MIVWGIDPGIYGAIGMIAADSRIAHGHPVRGAQSLSLRYHKEALDIGFRVLNIYATKRMLILGGLEPDLIVMETPLQTMAKGGKTTGSGRTLAATWFNFSRLYSILEDSYNCPLLFISAPEWKKWAALTKKLKAASVEEMHRRFGHMIAHLEMANTQQGREGQADALLIAAYGLEMYGDRLHRHRGNEKKGQDNG